MLAIAHRGCAGQYPENTRAAIVQSAPHVDGVEIDVKRCGSGELVLFHDDDLERVTGYSGEVTETEWERLAGLTVHQSGEPIPRLEPVVESWPDGVLMNLDIHDTGVAPEAVAIASACDERVVLSSTSTDVLAEVEQGPSVSLGFSFAQNPAENVEVATAASCDYVHVHDRLALGTDVVDRAHRAGLSVDAWTVDQRSTVSELRALGVDAVTVDRWDILGPSES